MATAFINCINLNNINVSENAMFCSYNDVIYSITNGSASAFFAPKNISGSITIPSSVFFNKNTYSVTSISNYAFQNCSKLENVVIPDSVTSIGSNAFAYCLRLETINILDAVTSINDYAFQGCLNIESITIGKSTKTMNSYAICSDTILNNVSIDSKNTSFFNDNGLVYKITGTNTASLFFCPRNKSGDFTIPDTVTASSGTYKVTDIAYGAFYNCNKLTNIVMGSNITKVNDRAFYNCTSLQSVSIGTSVTSIGSNVVQNCTNLSTLTIPDSTTSVGGFIYESCFNVTNVSIGKNATVSSNYNLGKYCKNVTITVDSNNTYFFTDVNGVIYYITSSVNKEVSLFFCPKTIVGDFTIPDTILNRNTTYNVTSIYGSAFAYCINITSINIGQNVTMLYDANIFEGCSKLASITLPDSVIKIANGAFFKCTGLTTININNDIFFNVDGIVYQIIASNQVMVIFCPNTFVDVTIPDTVEKNGTIYYVTDLQTNSFAYNGNLSSVSIGKYINSVGNYTFAGCLNLDTMTIHKDNSILFNADGLVYKILNSSSVSIYFCPRNINGTFTIPESVTYNSNTYAVIEVTPHAFQACTNVKCIIFSNIIILSTRTFQGCTNLTSIVIPYNVQITSQYQFYECPNLTSVYCLDNNPGIYHTQFDNIDNVTCYYLPGKAGWSLLANNKIAYHVPTIDSYNVMTNVLSGSCDVGLSTVNVYLLLDDEWVTYEVDSVNGQWTLQAILKNGEKISMISNYYSETMNSTEYTYCITIKTTTLRYDAGYFITESVNAYGDETYKWQYSNDAIEWIDWSDSYKISETIFASVTGKYLRPMITRGSLKIYDIAVLHKDGNDITITLGNNVQTIKNGAFYQCKSITAIVIPSSVISIGKFAFKCSGIHTITVNNNLYFSSVDGILYDKQMTELLCYPPKKTGDTFTLPSTVTTIASAGISGCTSLKNILSNSSAFRSLDGILYSADNTSILFYPSGKPDSVFAIPSYVTTIQSEGFIDCLFSSIIIGINVTSIQSFFLQQCNNVEMVTIPSAVSFVTDDSPIFYANAKLDSVLFVGDYVEHSEIQLFDSITSQKVYYLAKNPTWSGITTYMGTPAEGITDVKYDVIGYYSKFLEYRDSLIAYKDTLTNRLVTLNTKYINTKTKMREYDAIAYLFYSAIEYYTKNKSPSDSAINPFISESDKASGITQTIRNNYYQYYSSMYSKAKTLAATYVIAIADTQSTIDKITAKLGDTAVLQYLEDLGINLSHIPQYTVYIPDIDALETQTISKITTLSDLAISKVVNSTKTTYTGIYNDFVSALDMMKFDTKTV